MARPPVLTAVVVAIFGLTALVFVQFAPFRGATVGAVDMTTRHTTPYIEDRDSFERARNTLQTDQTDEIALAATFWRGVKRGEVRSWEPRLGMGAPLGGVVYTRVWSPFYWVGLIVPAALLSSYAVWLCLWTAQLGTWALARRLGMGHPGALFAGVAYGYSGAVTALLLRINEAAVAPWVFLAVHAVVSVRDGQRLPRVAGLSIAVAFMWLSGFPAASLFVLYAAGAVAVGAALMVVGPHLWAVTRRLAPCLGGVVAGTLLVTPLLLPSLEFLRASEALDRSFPSSHAAGPALLGGSVSGRLMGTFQHGTWWWPDPGYSNPVEASVTAGLVALLLLSIGAAGRRTIAPGPAGSLVGRLYLPLGAVVLIGTFMGGTVLAVLHWLPFLAGHSFGRSRFLLGLSIALAAGVIFDGLVRPPDERRSAPPVFRMIAAGMVVASVTGLALVWLRSIEEDAQDRVLGALGVPATCALVALVMLLVLAKRSHGTSPRTITAGSLVVVAALAVELQWGAWGFTPVVPHEEGFYPWHESFASMPRAADGSARFAGTELPVIRPNAGAWHELSDLRISHPSNERSREFLREVDPGVFERARLRTWFTHELDPTSPLLDRAAVRYLVAPGKNGVLDAVEAESVPVVDDRVVLGTDGQPVRGLRLGIDERCRSGQLSVIDADGRTLGRRPLWQRRTGKDFEVALADVEGGPAVLDVTGCDLTLPEEATVLRARDTTDLQVSLADGVVVYERLRARPRVELATEVLGISEAETRLDALAELPATTTVFDGTMSRRSLAGGEARVVADRGDRLTVEVEAAEPGYLLVRDAHAPGWRATVDGEAADILHADHAFRAVEVAAGGSIVEMSYEPTTRRIGWSLAGSTLLSFVIAAGVGRLRRRVARAGDAPVMDSRGEGLGGSTGAGPSGT